MGVKELWPILTPYCERKPINVLRGKIVAIDLAGWVCESLNVVDYFIHPRQYMKNLFFRTCYMLLEGIIPVFILEGKAPELKAKKIKERNEIQFRGVKPKNDENLGNKNKYLNDKEFKGRTRFNYVLKNCESLLNCIGIACVQAPGEAEAYAAFLNKKGFVDGIISQDSDCFAYGAIKVYRNFAVSAHGATSTQGASVDIYDMKNICDEIDFGQEKVIAMALFCGCDYSDGVAGVGKDSVTKLFKKYKNFEILEKIKSWRYNDTKYSELEIRVNDKNICSNCGHLGKTISHSKSGCSVCVMSKGCQETGWKEEKLIIKAEVTLRQKSLQDPNFPNIAIINEFIAAPQDTPNINLEWRRPNMIKFIKSISNLLQWSEIYSLQKFLPLLTRWQVQQFQEEGLLSPDFIVKKRTVKGNQCYEVVWKDEKKLFENLIPDEQVQSYCLENPKGIQSMWTTVEPANMLENIYPELVEKFHKSKEKPKKSRTTKKSKDKDKKNLLDMSSLSEITDKISQKVKRNPTKRKGLQLIDKFFYKTYSPEQKNDKNLQHMKCSTPKKKLSLLDLEYEPSYEENDMSEIINNIISHTNDKQHVLLNFSRKKLIYETVNFDCIYNQSKDDLHILPNKRKKQSNTFINNTMKNSLSLDDLSVIEISDTNFNLNCENSMNVTNEEISFFFEKVDCKMDEFEKSLMNDLDFS